MSEKKKDSTKNSEKSREEILAEREAKKQAKKGKKLKELQSATKEIPVPDTAVKSVDHTLKPNVTGDGQCKSREEVLAERNAKKQAKHCKKDAKDKITSDSRDAKQQASDALQSIENKEKVVPIVTAVGSALENSAIENKQPEKSKSQLRAERRAKQEAQRAKKTDTSTISIKTQQSSIRKKEELLKKDNSVKPKKMIVTDLSPHRVKLFAHLYDLKTSVLKGVEDMHPSITWLGAQYRNRVICGSNVRCLALLCSLKKVISDYKPSVREDISRGLEGQLTHIMNFLNSCRPVSVSMSNAVKHLKQQITNTSGPEREAKEELLDWIETYVKDQLEKAAEAISISVRGKISNGDVILTYSCSSLVEKILIAAAKDGISFRVIVVDGRPWLEGREMLRRLILAGIQCTYILVNAVSFVMPEVTKILLGAHALLANGYVMSRAGASQVALLGKAMNVPVLVCCETHKFSERVQTDSFVYNELGNPDELLAKPSPSVTPLNLVYDVTPPDLVSAVVTELAFLPCTSVPVILRIK